MHLLIPFAFCSSDACAVVLRTLQLPQLQKLLSRLVALPMDTGDGLSLSPPHERALARAMGLPQTDGLIPWAALEAAQAGMTGGAWGFITPCHWHSGSGLLAMSGLTLPDFSEQASKSLLAAMQPYFEEDGIALHYFEPTRWLARSELFNALATASLERVAGRDVQDWLPRGANAARVQRLQAEMQMLLYTHPVNDEREARGLPTVNAFWLSGTGMLAPAHAPRVDPEPVVVTRLRDAALREDWPAWAQAWATLDATECTNLLAALKRAEPVQLTLCGERNALVFRPVAQTFHRRFMNILRSPDPAGVLERL